MKVCEIQQSFNNNYYEILAPHRMFIYEGDVSVLNSSVDIKLKSNQMKPTKMHLFIFNDSILFCQSTNNSSGSSEGLQYINPELFSLANIKFSDVTGYDPPSFSVAIDDKPPLVLLVDNDSEKAMWLQKLEESMKEFKSVMESKRVAAEQLQGQTAQTL